MRNTASTPSALADNVNPSSVIILAQFRQLSIVPVGRGGQETNSEFASSSLAALERNSWREVREDGSEWTVVAHHARRETDRVGIARQYPIGDRLFNLAISIPTRHARSQDGRRTRWSSYSSVPLLSRSVGVFLRECIIDDASFSQSDS